MADIVLKDRDGNPVTYPDISAISALLADGNEQLFSAGSSAVANAGKFTGNNGIYTLEHGLGVTPDVFLLDLIVGFGSSTSLYLVEQCACLSTKAINLGFPSVRTRYRNGTYSTDGNNGGRKGIDVAYAGVNHVIHSANDKTIQIGSEKFVTYSKTANCYYWFAMGGLT